MIAIFDEDGGGDVDFQEFVSGLSAFSSKGNKEEKLRFAFKVYDIDRDGYISNGELFLVLKMMVGSNLKDQQLQQVCACPDSNGADRGWDGGGWLGVRGGRGFRKEEVAGSKRKRSLICIVCPDRR
jgi:hypothetical protein